MEDQEEAALAVDLAEAALVEAEALAEARAAVALEAHVPEALAREALGDQDVLILAAVGAGGIIIAPIITAEAAALAA